MLDHRNVYCLGYSSGIAGSDTGSGDGPRTLQKSSYIQQLSNKKIEIHWGSLIQSNNINLPKLNIVAEQTTMLADSVSHLVQSDKFFIVFGGDHSCAIGTWSGVKHAIGENHELGLIWIDAHMDSHTPETTPTGNIHGMPLACLLGHGDSKLTSIMTSTPKLKPENICLIGIRSYEEGEEALLKKLNVRIYFMEEVKKRGMESIMKEAISIVKKNTSYYGVSLDIDALDPKDAPGTGVVESGGIPASEIYSAFNLVKNDASLIGVEIAEFDPHRDENHKTEIVISKLVSVLTAGESHV